MTAQLEEAQVKLKKADRYLKLSIIVFIVFMISATGLVSYQLYELQRGLYSQQKQSEERAQADREAAQQRLEKALTENQNQHKKTQAYVKCIANALLMPVAQRSEKVLDECGLETTAPRTTPNSIDTPAVMPTPQVQPSKPSSSQPTTSSPPDPDEPVHDQAKGTIRGLAEDATTFFKNTTTGINNLFGAR
jgi:hypothetical protein